MAISLQKSQRFEIDPQKGGVCLGIGDKDGLEEFIEKYC